MKINQNQQHFCQFVIVGATIIDFMKDVLIIVGTNRPHSATRMVAAHISTILQSYCDAKVLSLEVLNDQLCIQEDMYEKNMISPFLQNMQKQILIPARNWIIVSPEYNGSFPGIIKLWLDALSVSNAAETFHHKKVGLVGVASGRAGNLRGMDHLTSIFHYLHMEVMPFKLPVSAIRSHTGKDGTLNPEVTLPLEDFCKRFLAYIR